MAVQHSAPWQIPKEALELLRRLHTDKTPHTGRSLIDHLVGTYQLLESWGNSQAIRLAGLFHSIYGTNLFVFRSARLDQRREVRAVIGDTAEHLAYLFCTCDRPLALLRALLQPHIGLPDMTDGSARTVEPQELSALLEIEVANFLEHPEDREVIAQINRIICSTKPSALSPGAAAALAAYLCPKAEQGRTRSISRSCG
jgi:hypothetical protein